MIIYIKWMNVRKICMLCTNMNALHKYKVNV